MIARCRPNPIRTVYSPRPLLPDPGNFLLPNPSRITKQNSSFGFPRKPESTRPCNSRHDLLLSCLSHTLKISTEVELIGLGKQVHAHVVKAGLCQVLSLQNQLLHVYVKRKLFREALALLDEIPVRNVVTWNTWICGVTNCGTDDQLTLQRSITSFMIMLTDSVNPDHLTFNSLIRGCVEFDNIGVGMQLHCFVVKYGNLVSCFVSVGLICLYGKFSRMQEVRWVFDELSYRDLAVWNALLSCYSLTCLAEEAFMWHNTMRLEGMKGDEYTFSTLFGCCARSGFWELVDQLHGTVISLGFDADILVASALVDAYSKSGRLEDAHRAFNVMPSKNVVSWNTLIKGYVQHGNQVGAMRLLREMHQKGFHPDESTLASAISSCGNSSSMCGVAQLHIFAIKVGIISHLSVLNSLVSAYSKCGSIGSSTQCFRLIKEPDLVTWTSIICGYGFNGLATEAVDIFWRMLSSGIKPDKIVFLVVISACAHAGMISEGLYHFDLMVNEYNLTPDAEQYACLIDLAARAGLVGEAFAVFTSLPEVEWSALGAVLGACQVHRNANIAAEAVGKLSLLEPRESANYALMSNIYASEGKWVEVARLRKMMRDRCGFKVPGFSWIEITGIVHPFVSSDKSHPKTAEIYVVLSLLLWELDETRTPTVAAPWMNNE